MANKTSYKILQNVSYVESLNKELKKIKVTQSDEKEILKLHKRRKSSKLMAKDNLSIQFIRQCIATDQAYRSRIVYMKIEVKKTTDYIDALYSATLTRLILDSEVKLSGITTKTDRKAFFELYLDSVVKKFDPLYRAIDIANYVIEDIDKCAWSLRDLLKSFELSTRPDLNL